MIFAFIICSWTWHKNRLSFFACQPKDAAGAALKRQIGGWVSRIRRTKNWLRFHPKNFGFGPQHECKWKSSKSALCKNYGLRGLLFAGERWGEEKGLQGQVGASRSEVYQVGSDKYTSLARFVSTIVVDPNLFVHFFKQLKRVLSFVRKNFQFLCWVWERSG